jgi:hypothetical protein
LRPFFCWDSIFIVGRILLEPSLTDIVVVSPMSLLRRFYDLIKSNSPFVGSKSRQIQREVDTLRVYMLTQYHKELSSGVKIDRNEFFGRAENVSHDSQVQAVEENLLGQVGRLFAIFYDCDPQAKPPEDDLSEKSAANRSVYDELEQEGVEPDSFPIHNPGTSRRRRVPESDKEDAFNIFNGALRAAMGFSVHTRPSLIPGAGDGVFVEGTVPPGAVVALYPGVVYLRDYVQAGDHDGLFGSEDDGAYTISRFDGTIINADCPLIGRHTPLAVGHIVNHPSGIPDASSSASPGSEILEAKLFDQPNVMVFPINFPRERGEGDENAALRPQWYPYIPNTYYKPATVWSTEEAKNSQVQGLALIATREIADGEIYLDYRYNQSLKLPAWYKPVNVEENERRWAK